MEQLPTTVVEFPAFTAAAENVWTAEEKEAFIDYISRHPLAGAVVQGTGGVRKVRWLRTGMGKSGGVRVIYFHHSARLPLFLLTVYAKNVQADLGADQKRAMKRLVEAIVTGYGK